MIGYLFTIHDTKPYRISVTDDFSVRVFKGSHFIIHPYLQLEQQVGSETLRWSEKVFTEINSGRYDLKYIGSHKRNRDNPKVKKFREKIDPSLDGLV